MIVFLAATSTALIINAVIAWFAYKALASMSAQAAERMDAFRKSDTREWIRTLETVSTRAAEVTTEAKTEIVSFEPSLMLAEERLKFAIERADKSCDTVCNAVTKSMDVAGKVASRGHWIVNQLVSGARAASAFVRAARSR